MTTTMTTNNDRSRLDRYADWWTSLSRWVAARPVQLLTYLVGAVIIIAVGVVIYSSEHQDRVTVDQVKSSLCSTHMPPNSARQRANCQRLLDNLLLHPTPQQVQRIRQISQNKGP